MKEQERSLAECQAWQLLASPNINLSSPPLLRKPRPRFSSKAPQHSFNQLLSKPTSSLGCSQSHHSHLGKSEQLSWIHFLSFPAAPHSSHRLPPSSQQEFASLNLKWHSRPESSAGVCWHQLCFARSTPPHLRHFLRKFLSPPTPLPSNRQLHPNMFKPCEPSLAAVSLRQIVRERQSSFGSL